MVSFNNLILYRINPNYFKINYDKIILKIYIYIYSLERMGRAKHHERS